MRKGLAKSQGVRKRFKATFVRVGKKTNYKGYPEDTLLLTNVIDFTTNEVVTDHLWFTFSKVFEQAGMREGDSIEFDARVKEYKKGYVNKLYKIDKQRIDFKLSHPTRIVVVSKK